MRKFFLILFFFGFVVTSSTRCHAEIIRSFNTDVRVSPDSTLQVAENIVMDFEGTSRHGIYRTIPVRYFRNGNSYSIYIRDLRVTNERGQNLEYSNSRDGNDLNLKIGNADTFVSGVQTYRIGYTVRRAVNFFDGAPEVYWNATGDQWRFPIQSATARFFAPNGVTVSQIKSKSFRGRPRSTEAAQNKINTDNLQFSTTSLQPGECLTFVVGLPKGSVQPVGALQNLWWIFADWWPLLVFPLATASLLYSRYNKSGRDEIAVGAVGVEWNPPPGLSPAEVGTLVDEKCDTADMVSTVVDLAARGYLRIEEQKNEGFLFLSSKDYLFTKRDDAPPIAALAAHEQLFYAGLFAIGDRVLLSSLKNSFYTNLPPIKTAIYDGLTQKKIFNANPDTVRNQYLGVGFVMLVLGFIASIFGAASGYVAYGLGLLVAGILVLMFSRAMPSRTKEGVLALRHCLSFQRFVRMAEKDRIAVLAKDDPTIFGRLLPFAMVLGVADQWAFAFKDLMSEPPDWYVPYGYGHGYMFNSHAFVNDLGGGMNTMGNTFASQPSSQGAGGGSSGFSGGGGSGGGFGGGGGGSW